MNKHLAQEIWDILKDFEKADFDGFEEYASKKPTKNKDGHKYLKLFHIYLKEANAEVDLNEAKIAKEASKISNSPSDLNQKLHEELLKFICFQYREKSITKIESEISDALDTSVALLEKKMYSLSAKTLLKAIKIINEDLDTRLQESLLYLALKAHSLVYQIAWSNSVPPKVKAELYAYTEKTRSFLQLARMAYGNLREKEQEHSLDTKAFDNATFYSLLNIYFRERSLFDSQYKDQGNYNHFPVMDLVKGSYKNFGNADENAEKIEGVLIGTESFYFQINRLYKAILANEQYEFNNAFDAIRNRVFAGRNFDQLNAGVLLFLQKELFELKTIYTLEHHQKPFDVNQFKELDKLNRDHSVLISESSEKDFALRVELNSMIILLLHGNFKELYTRVIEMEKITKRNSGYFFDMKLLAIICLIENRDNIEELLKRAKSYTEYTKKYPCSVFHKKFDGLISAYLNAAANSKEIKQTLKTFLPKIEKARESLNHFQSVFIYWLNSKL